MTEQNKPNKSYTFTIKETEQTSTPKLDLDYEYENIKKQNRRRLIGAGAIALAILGLFAILASTNADRSKTIDETQYNGPILANTEPTTQPASFTPDAVSTVPTTDVAIPNEEVSVNTDSVIASNVQAASDINASNNIASSTIASHTETIPTSQVATEPVQPEPAPIPAYEQEQITKEQQQQQIVQNAKIAQQKAQQARRN